MIRMRGAVGSIASVAAVLVLAGCGQDSGGDAQTSEAAPRPAAAPCSLLDAAAIEDLAGTALEGSANTINGTDLAACRYGNLSEVGIQVARVPANEWATALPAAVDALKKMPAGAIPPGVVTQLEDAAKLIDEGKSIPADEACDYFSTLLEVQNQPPGSTKSVTLYPSARAPKTINGQQCVDNTYTTITVGRPDIATTPDLKTKVETILDQLK
ncbi:hypothetical protein [Antrihabitans spumae]|uniref:DUF3558 domain-containing protein n=1 Tax=Antrihabitans spumae TaxID=3373370 RepID=A0ABW7KKF1_9NOCA